METSGNNTHRTDAGEALPPTGSETEMLSHRLEKVICERDHFAEEVQQLQKIVKSRGQDSSEVVTYMKAQIESANQRESDLLEEVERLKGQLEEDPEKIALKKQIEKLREEHSDEIRNISMKNNELKTDMDDVLIFKEMRGQLLAELEASRNQVKEKEKVHEEKLLVIERKFLEAKDRLQKEAQQKLIESRDIIRQEVWLEMDAETQKVRSENQRMVQELQFHEQTSDALQQQNDILRYQLSQLQMEVELIQEKEKEYALRGVRQRKRIKESGGKLKALEKSLGQTLRDIEIERSQWHEEHSRELNAAKKETERLKHAYKLQSKELKKIKRLAQTILEQRNETEQFFHEALAQVKKEVRAQMSAVEEKKQATLSSSSKSPLVFPSVRKPSPTDRTRRNTPPPSSLPAGRVQISDLSPSQKEKVLRLLFSKINNMKSARLTAPQHSFMLTEGEEEVGGERPDDETFLTNMSVET